MAYSWTTHLKKVCGLLQKDGDGFTVKLYAVDPIGKTVTFLDPTAVRWCLVGANYKVLSESIPSELTADERGTILVKRSIIMAKLYHRAGLTLIPNQVSTSALFNFSKTATWEQTEELLRKAYKIAKAAEAKCL